MTNASTELENVGAKIAELRTLWQSAAAAGKHGEAVSLKNEIRALEDASERYEIQRHAEAAESRRRRAVDAAKATLEQIEQHRGERAELERLVVEVEAAATAIDETMRRLRAAWPRCRISYPTQEQFADEAMQKSYEEALAGNRFPSFEPLRLGLRLPVVLDSLRAHCHHGLYDIIGVTDPRF